jgi:hypothetical protein
MRIRPPRPNVLRAGSWLALTFLLTTAVAGATEPAAGTDLVGGGTESSQREARPPAYAAKPRIGRIFFSPAERARHRDGFVATPTPAAQSGGGPAPRERRVVNGALSTGTRGRAVWVNGTAVEDSAREKPAWTDRNGNIWVMNGAEGTHLLKPGQSIDRSGVIEDLLPPGSVARR